MLKCLASFLIAIPPVFFLLLVPRIRRPFGCLTGEAYAQPPNNVPLITPKEWQERARRSRRMRWVCMAFLPLWFGLFFVLVSLTENSVWMGLFMLLLIGLFGPMLVIFEAVTRHYGLCCPYCGRIIWIWQGRLQKPADRFCHECGRQVFSSPNSCHDGY